MYEGFGLPVLEAYSNSALVVTTNISSLPEVGGDAAIYYDNVQDEKELAEKIMEAMNLDEDCRNEKIEKGIKQTKKFTWEKCTKETIEIFCS